MKRKIHAFDIVNAVLLALFAFVTIYPFWYVLVGSFNNGIDYSFGGVWLWPRAFTADSYRVVFADPRLWHSLLITVLRTVIGTAVSLAFTSLVAYAMSRRELKHKAFFQAANLITMFFSGGLIPFYLLVNIIGLYDNFLVYILPMTYSVFNMIVIASFFRGLPDELRESARIDGANEFRIWLTLYMPLSKAVLATVGLWVAVGHWNSYMATLLYTKSDTERLWTLQYYLLRLIKESSLPSGENLADGAVSAQTVTFAAMVVATIPMAALYPLLSKYFAKGAVVGSIKG
ncbi:MAG: carbohydrate ABC transporter permease [Clostridiales bacterium]|jgi:putative aldouronate transport system permease protein|nr:carbohydrate ABC transporter permease [Clostridiales bacterium]